jgi:hypothetical protein
MAKFRIRKEISHDGETFYWIEKREWFQWLFCGVSHDVMIALDLFSKYSDPKKYGLTVRGTNLFQSNEIIEKTENKIL